MLSTRQRYASLRFAGGVRADDGVKASGEDAAYAGFVPLVETTSAEKAETPTSGTLDMVMQLVEQENLRDAATLPYRLLGSAPGEGSQEVAQLSAPGPYYQQLLRDIRHGRQLAAAQHESYGVGAVTWSQGEADDADRTTIAAYEASLRALRADIDRDAKAITGQHTDVEMVTYQVATAKSFDQPSPHIALALLQASHDDPHIHLAVPMYLFRYVDGRHIDNRSARWLGAYYGLVIKRLVIDHRAWKPLEPVAWQHAAAVVTVRFNVPAPPLRWDTGQVAANRDFGFTLRTPDGHVVPIRSAAITAPDTITITAAQPVAPGTHLEYAFDGVGMAGNEYGPRGNLRDSQGDTIVFDDGIERLRLDNWCVIFDVTL